MLLTIFHLILSYVPVLIVLLLVLIGHYYYVVWSNTGLPPGPFPFPIVGNIAVMTAVGKSTHFKLLEMGKKYNGIFTLFIGTQPTIWITSFKHFHEALVTRGWDCAGRPPELFLEDVTDENYDTVAFSGTSLLDREIRKFVLTALKNTGFVDTRIQQRALEEIDYLVEALTKNNGEPFNPKRCFLNAIGNSIAAILFGKRFSDDDEEFQKVMETFSKSAQLLLASRLDGTFPVLKLIPRKSKQECIEGFRYVCDFMRKQVEQNKTTWQKGAPRNFMDAWMDKSIASETDLDKEAFAITRLPIAMMSVFLAGYETSTFTILWLVAVLLWKPDVQEKVQTEIHDAIGRNGTVTLEDRDIMPYTEAVVLETTRMFPAVPFTLPHFTVTDTVIAGYHIPKGTRVLPHIFSVHYDPDLWDQPHKFRPERFLRDGQVCIPPHYVAFSDGRRICMGKKVALAQMFLILGNLMQRIRFHRPKENVFPSFDLQSHGFGITLGPDDFDVRVVEREEDDKHFRRQSSIWPGKFIPSKTPAATINARISV